MSDNINTTIKLKNKNISTTKWMPRELDNILRAIFLSAVRELYSSNKENSKDALKYLKSGDLWCLAHKYNYDKVVIEKFQSNDMEFKKRINLIK